MHMDEHSAWENFFLETFALSLRCTLGSPTEMGDKRWNPPKAGTLVNHSIPCSHKESKTN